MFNPTLAWRLGALLVPALLVACGAGGATAPTAPPATVAPTAAATAPQATPAPAASAAPAETPTGDTQEAAVPRGKTVEGYNYLGNPDAPVTIQDFSDFF